MGRVDVDADRGERAAAELDIADALDLEQLLRQHRGDGIVDLAGRARLRGQRNDHDRRVGGVHLPVGRVRAQRRRQVDPRRIDRRLDVACRTVDVAVERKLQRNAGAAEPRVRGHLGNVGDGAEAAFERGRDAGAHGVGAGTGQAGADRDGREIDLRQRRDRQREEPGRARDDDADGQQDGADRPPDEGRGDVHASVDPVRAGSVFSRDPRRSKAR